ncbi:MAG: MBL fold metallo-hydrolase [Solirubrobacterales bacterium]|nr:MBL fold metallo-hydrolase [Solirubrobacterales bacterium]
MTRLELEGRDVVGIRAANPGPFSLTGTNSWIIGRDPAWLVDPGPALGEHVAALLEELEARGGLGGIALTHHHADHAEAVPAIRERFPQAAVAAAREHVARGRVDTSLSDGAVFGPLTALATPGHTADHLAFVRDEIAFTGDAVLGEGSVFISPDPGALAGYLEALTRLRGLGLALLCPGHGPVIGDPAAKLDEYIAHRLDRERRLEAALATGKRSARDLLDAAWNDVPAELRPAAAVTLAAHLDKLDDEGSLPAGVERPRRELP